MWNTGRYFWLAVGSVGYLIFAALGAGSSIATTTLCAAAALAVLAEGWRRSGAPRGHRDPLGPTGRSALRATVWGAALWLSTRAGPAGSPGFDAVANLANGAACIGALLAISHMPSPGGLLSAHPGGRALDAIAFMALVWTLALSLPLGAVLLPGSSLLVDPLAIDYATTTASIGTLLVLVAATWRARAYRRLEMGVGERCSAALALTLTAFGVGVPSAAAGVGSPDRVLALAALLASVACTWAATAPEPRQVTSALRGLLTVAILGVPTALLVGAAARRWPAETGAIALAGCSLAVLEGVLARQLTRRLAPEESRWLDALEEASRGAVQPEPEAALRAALMALQKVTQVATESPELWQAAPAEVITIDLAGNLHTQRAACPAGLYDAALQEPERTLRVEVLRALEVRRPDLRGLLSWFQHRRAASATVVTDEDGPLGAIVMPVAGRHSPVSIEEAHALRVLADRISALLAVSSALARSRERELGARTELAQVSAERRRLEQLFEGESERHRARARALADDLRRSAYSAAARLTLHTLERLAQASDALLLECPTGEPPAAWAAAVHLASRRAAGPLLVVDAAAAAWRDRAAWTREVGSPIDLCDGGTLVVANAPALPRDVQDQLAARLLRARSAPSGSLPPLGVVLAAPLGPPGAEPPALAPSLAAATAQARVTLPTLAERGEDLRPMVLERLAREGLALRGEALGIEPRALAVLMDHTWPSNSTELDAAVVALARVARAPTVGVADLAAIGFHAVPEAPPAPARSSRPRRRPRALRAERHS